MRISQKTIFHNSILQLIFLIFSLMFLTIVFLTVKLLSNENCILSQTENVRMPYENIRSNRQTNSNNRLAVLVPFRERFEELLTFAPHMHTFLSNQNINHDIFILNQVDFYRFNRASLINVGFNEIKQNYTYIAMHDVDLLPLNNNLLYSYPKQPMHIAAPNLHPRYHYEKFIGGILLINREHFELANGLSNKYWGWGLEDDEFYVRLRDAKLTVIRPENITTGTNNTFKHIHGKERKRDTAKCYNQREVTRKRDRQTGLHDVKYNIKGRTRMSIEGAPLTVINIQLVCDHNLTPWCDCTPKKTENIKTIKG